MRRQMTFGGAAVPDKNIPDNERLIFAMDVPNCDRARQLAEELGAARHLPPRVRR